MKFSIQTNSFRSAVQKTAPAANGSKVPILGNLLLEVGPEFLHIIAGNGEKTVSVVTDCDTEESGRIALPAKVLAGIVGEANGEFIKVQVSGNRATLVCGGDKWEIAGESAEDYPPMPELQNVKTWEMPASTLASCLSQVFPARADSKLARPLLESVFMGVDSQSVVFVATSGRALAMTKADFQGEEGSVIIPEDFVRDLVKNANGTATISVSETLMKVEFPGVTIHSRLLEGSYPNWKQFLDIPKDKKVTFKKTELLGAVRRVIQIGSDKDDLKRISLTFEPHHIDVSITHQHSSNSRVACEGDGDLVVWMNADLFTQVLSGCPHDEITCTYLDGRNGITFTAGEWMGAIMPLRP